MKKGLIFATTLAMMLGVGVAVGAHQEKAPVKTEAVAAGEKVYLLPNADWKSAGARFAVYSWSGESSNQTWTNMTAETGTDYYKATIPSTAEKVIFCRMDGSKTENSWTNKWNQSSDLLLSNSNGNIYKITGWDNSGEWDGGSYDIDDHPSAEGYYLLSSELGWTFADGVKMVTCEEASENYALIEGYEAAANEKINVRKYFNKTSYWCASDVIISTAGKKNIYLSKDNSIYVSDYVAPVVYSVKPKWGSTYFTFSNDDEHKPEGADHQYKATVTDAVYYATKLEFYADGVKMTSNISADTGTGNNLVGDVTNGFKVHTPSSTGMDVYLKQYGSDFVLWGTGYAENTFDLTCDGSSLGALSVDSEFEPYGDYVKQYKTSSAVNLSKLNVSEETENYYISSSGGSVTIALETAGENNAVAKGTSSVYFDVHNDCTEVVYLKQKADLSLVLYIGGYEAAHVLTIGGKNVTLHKVAENKYAATGVSLTAGDTVTAYTIEGVAQTVSAEVVGNNNLDAAKKVLVTNASADIYFNTQTSELWISGLPNGGYHLYKNSSSVVLMVETDDYGEYKQWKTESVSFAVGDTVEILDANGEAGVKGPDVWTITEFEESPTSVNFEVKDGKIKCKTACTTSVYLKLKYKDDRIYFGAEAQYITKAKEFANSFKSAMAAACSAEGKKDAVEEAWAAQATAFAALVKEAQDELKLGSFSSVEEVREFGERYISIKQQHSAWTLTNFLSWDIPASSRYAGLDEFNATDSNAMIIVIAIAAISALAFTTLLVLKKRKQR